MSNQNKTEMKKEALKEMRPVWVRAYANRKRCPVAEAESAFDSESEYFEMQTEASPDLKECTELSLKNAFLSIAVDGISIQPGGKAEAYLESRNVKKRENGNESWMKVCSLRISPYGELNMRIMAGQIVRASNPIILYEGDHFQPRTNEQGDLVVDYCPAIPRKSGRIIGCYIQIILPRGGKDYKWLLEDDIARLMGYSARQKRDGKPNALYMSNQGQIDPGFLEAKTLKHAMRSYTKLRVSEYVRFEDEMDETETEDFTPEPENGPETVTYQGGGEEEEETF